MSFIMSHTQSYKYYHFLTQMDPNALTWLRGVHTYIVLTTFSSIQCEILQTPPM